MKLIVYRCYDNLEEEACFLTGDPFGFLDSNPDRPEGFEERPGYYFFEDAEGY